MNNIILTTRQKLLLNMLDNNEIEGSLRMQKVIFLAQLNIKNNHTKNLNYNYYRWDKGPFSKELSNDLTYLENLKLINIEKTLPIQYQISKKGKILNKELHLNTKNTIEEIILNSIVNKYSKMNIKEVIEETYDLADIESYTRGEPIII